MDPDDLDRLLRSGADDVAESAGVADPAAIRRRGDQRRRRSVAMSAVLALAICAGGGSAAYAALGRPVVPSSVAASGTSSIAAGTHNTAATAAIPDDRPGIVAVTTAGAVQVLNPQTGMAVRTLAPVQDAIGDEVGVSPDGQIVYFAVRYGCADDAIESVPVSGGSKPVVVAHGALPAVSPDGSELAFVQEQQWPGRNGWVDFTCPSYPYPATPKITVLNLSTGSAKVYAGPSDGVPISHLSWSPDGTTLLVSAGPGNRELTTLGVATGRYTGTVPMTLTAPAGLSWYYREGVYLPSGSIFVNQICCDGISNQISATVLAEVSASGSVTQRVATGLTGDDHTSLATDPSGEWLLYLSGDVLYLSGNGGKAFELTNGLIAAAWL
jgi:hypothetical protein